MLATLNQYKDDCTYITTVDDRSTSATPGTNFTVNNYNSINI